MEMNLYFCSLGMFVNIIDGFFEDKVKVLFKVYFEFVVGIQMINFKLVINMLWCQDFCGMFFYFD